jgi:hypothetical protein
VQARRQKESPVVVWSVHTVPGTHSLLLQHCAPSPPQMFGSKQVLHWLRLPLQWYGLLQVPWPWLPQEPPRLPSDATAHAGALVATIIGAVHATPIAAPLTT